MTGDGVSRIGDLKNRLVAWGIAGDQLSEIWDGALYNFVKAYSSISDPFLVPEDLLLTCFERCLDDFDRILADFPLE